MGTLLTRYFIYDDANNNSKIDRDEIWAMRSDAFVEYCYAAAQEPIIHDDVGPVDITTVAGAEKLNHWHLSLLPVTPVTQRASMVPATVQAPQMKVLAGGGGAQLMPGQLLKGKEISVEASDLESGPAYLEIRNGASPADYNAETRPVPGPGVETGGENYTFSASSIGSLNPGTVDLRAFDHAGNYSDFSFAVAGKPVLNAGSVSPLYSGFTGSSAYVPSTLERDHSFSFVDTIAGVSSVLMTGPPGNVINWSFNPPLYSTGTSLAGMAPGQYSVRIVNSVGNETSALFNIGSLGVFLSTPASQQTLNFPPDPFSGGSASLAVLADVAGSNELDRAELADAQGRVLQTQPLSGYGGTVSFALPALSLPDPLFIAHLYNTGGGPSAGYALRLWDKKGNYTRQFFILALHDYAVQYDNFGPITGSGGGQGAVVDTLEYLDGNGFVHRQLPGALVSDYSVYTDTAGQPGAELGLGMNVNSWQESVSGGVTKQQNLGQLSVKVRTWSAGDQSDAVEYPLLSGTVYASTKPIAGMFRVGISGPWTGLYLSAPFPPKVPAKRYIQTKVDFQRAAPGAFLEELCAAWTPYCTDPNNSATCRMVSCDKGLIPSVLEFYNPMVWGGVTVSTPVYPDNEYAAVDLGTNVRVDLAGGAARVDFQEVTAAGTLSAVTLTVRPPSGFLETPADIAYDIVSGGNLSYTGSAKLTLKYDPAGLTPEQTAWLKIVRVIDPAAGRYEIIGGTPGPDNTLSADITQFGRYIVAVPEYASPKPLSAQNLEFLSGETVTSQPYDMSSAEGQALLQSIKSRDLMPIGPVTRLGPDGLQLAPSGAVTMRYSDADVAAAGVDENSLAIYQFTADGATLSKLPYLTLDTAGNVLTARVPGLTSLFAILASSRQVENMPPAAYPDGIPPESALSAGGMMVAAPDGVIVSTKTGIVLSGTDPVLPGVETSGYDLTNYLLDPVENTVDISTYSVPIISTEGTHSLFYFSVDKALNYEFPKGTTIYADGTPPVTMLSAGLYESGGRRYIAAGSSITLAAADPVSNGVASGRLATIYLVGTAVEACPELVQLLANPPQAPPVVAGPAGTCTNPLYSEPFTLEEGSTTLSYLSVDKVWNQEREHSDILYADGTAPETVLAVNGTALAAGATVNAIAGDTFTITAADALSNGVASGLAETYLYVDASPEECAAGTGTGGIAGPGSMGSCGNNHYTGQFTLAEGTHTVWYAAEDRVGNRSALGRAAVNVTVDDLPPVSSAGRQEEAAKKAAEFYRRMTDKLKPDEKPQYKGIYNNGPENRWENKDFYRPRENRP